MTEKDKVKKVEDKEKKKTDAGALFIPGGFLIGFGLGFITGNVPAFMFLGLGCGFVAWALVLIFTK